MSVPSGALRFNSDSGKLEYYNGEAWWQIDNFSADNATGGARGVFGGGTSPTNIIDHITISTTGNAIDFGDLINPTQAPGSCSSSTRGIFAGGSIFPLTPTFTNTIQYITISSTGDAIDFGDLSVGKNNLSACSSSTRGIIAAGFAAGTRYNIIEYITISSTGDAVDFGDLSVDKSNLSACSSSTRGIFAGGSTPTPAFIILNVIEYITISSTGNAIDFGDLSVGKLNLSACSSSTRGVFGGGITPTYVNVIEYITISSTGDAVDFGDLSIPNSSMGACSSSTRGVFGGGFTPTPAPSTRTNVIEYITILTQGNAIDFGDLTVGRNSAGGLSNAHGGL
jgi:hypothetical protein